MSTTPPSPALNPKAERLNNHEINSLRPPPTPSPTLHLSLPPSTFVSPHQIIRSASLPGAGAATKTRGRWTASHAASWVPYSHRRPFSTCGASPERGHVTWDCVISSRVGPALLLHVHPFCGQSEPCLAPSPQRRSKQPISPNWSSHVFFEGRKLCQQKIFFLTSV